MTALRSFSTGLASHGRASIAKKSCFADLDGPLNDRFDYTKQSEHAVCAGLRGSVTRCWAGLTSYFANLIHPHSYIFRFVASLGITPFAFGRLLTETLKDARSERTARLQPQARTAAIRRIAANSSYACNPPFALVRGYFGECEHRADSAPTGNARFPAQLTPSQSRSAPAA